MSERPARGTEAEQGASPEALRPLVFRALTQFCRQRARSRSRLGRACALSATLHGLLLLLVAPIAGSSSLPQQPERLVVTRLAAKPAHEPPATTLVLPLSKEEDWIDELEVASQKELAEPDEEENWLEWVRSHAGRTGAASAAARIAMSARSVAEETRAAAQARSADGLGGPDDQASVAQVRQRQGSRPEKGQSQGRRRPNQPSQARTPALPIRDRPREPGRRQERVTPSSLGQEQASPEAWAPLAQLIQRAAVPVPEAPRASERSGAAAPRQPLPTRHGSPTASLPETRGRDAARLAKEATAPQQPPSAFVLADTPVPAKEPIPAAQQDPRERASKEGRSASGESPSAPGAAHASQAAVLRSSAAAASLVSPLSEPQLLDLSTALNTGWNPMSDMMLALDDSLRHAWIIPDQVKASGIVGTTTVEFVLHPNGRVSDVKVVKQSGHAILDQLAAGAIPQRLRGFRRLIPAEGYRVRFSFRYSDRPVGAN